MSNQKYGILILAVGFATIILSISLFSFTMPSTVLVKSSAQENEKIQNLTETNIPKFYL